MNPPRLARWLLERVLSFHDRAAILGDLAEEFHARRRSGRPSSTWYWRQALAALPYAIGRRRPRARWIVDDTRFTVRLWKRYPAFTAATIGTQAVGIAITPAVLASAYAVLVRPLPYRDPGALVHLLEGTGRAGQLSFQDFVDLRRGTRSLDAVAGYSGGSRTLEVPGASPERVPIVAVTDGFFELLGVEPLAGRTYTAADMIRGGPSIAILSHQLGTRRFGADPAIVGRTISLNGIATEVVGVLPASFIFPLRGRPDLWLPQRPTPAQEERGYMHWLDVIARVKDGVTSAHVQDDLTAMAAGYAARDQRNHANTRLRAIPLRDRMVAAVRPTLTALLAGVVLVLIVMGATNATLLLSHSVPRRRELAVRFALGATRGRVLLQLLTENLWLSLAGGALGTAAGHGLLQLFVSRMPMDQRLALPYFEEAGVGLVVAAAVLGLSVVTGVAFGVLPALRAAGADGGSRLKTAAPTAGARETRIRAALVAVQVAVALVLLASAATLAISVHRLLGIPGVFDPGAVVTFRLNLPPKYATPASIDGFHQQLLESLEAAPGITSAAIIDQPPLNGSGNNGTLQVVGRPAPDPRTPPVLLRAVSDNYFPAMHVPLLAGRAFGVSDRSGSPQVVVINRLLADSEFGGRPIGERISFQFLPGEWEIVGVVDNERFDDIDRPLLPVVYFSTRQDISGSFVVMLRAADTGAAVATARAVVQRLDPSLPVFGVRTAEQITGDSAAVFLRRTTLWMLGMFASAAVVLAAMGLYGVLAQAVADRTREIGVRLALGATRGRIVRHVLRGAFLSVGIGAVLGVLGTAAASRWLSSLVFGVSARDPFVIAGAVVFLVLVALVACLVPVRRAVGISPSIAIRTDS